MNKLLSYIVLTLEDEEGKPFELPVKIGTYTLEKVAEDFKLELYEFGKLFQRIERTIEDGSKRISEVPKDPVKFYKSILLHGANYAALVNGKDGYQEKDAYKWLDQLGFNSEQTIKVLFAFMSCIQNGGTPIRLMDEEEDGKKKTHDIPSAA